jgi:hypothetical protein
MGAKKYGNARLDPYPLLSEEQRLFLCSPGFLGIDYLRS